MADGGNISVWLIHQRDWQHVPGVNRGGQLSNIQPQALCITANGGTLLLNVKSRETYLYVKAVTNVLI